MTSPNLLQKPSFLSGRIRTLQNIAIRANGLTDAHMMMGRHVLSHSTISRLKV